MPSNWELQGFDNPIYSNIRYPFPKNPSYIDGDYNLVGRYHTDIYPEDKVYLHVDYKRRGLAGDNSWGALPHEQYRWLDDSYSYSYRVSLIKE